MKKMYCIVITILVLIATNISKASAHDPNYIRLISERVSQQKEGGIFNLSFRSEIDGTIQPLLMKIPKGYDPNQTWPLLVVLHGRGDGPIIVPSIDSMVQIGPYGRGDLFYRGLGEKDVMETMELAKRIFSIDTQRIYLTGFSMGGAGTFDLGLKYPYLWAACVPVCGRLEKLQLIENGTNLPFWIHAGKRDYVVPASCSKTAYELGQEKGFTHWHYTEHEDMGHSFYVNWQEIETWLLGHHLKTDCKKIVYTSESPCKVHWFEVRKLTNPGDFCRFEVAVDDRNIYIATENIHEYKIHRMECPIPKDMNPVVYENGKRITDDNVKALFL